MAKDILKFIKDNKDVYVDFLMKIEGFPYVCDYSSEILGAYLVSKYGFNDVMIEGCYWGDSDCIHYWLEFDEYKIDFTFGQFHNWFTKYNDKEAFYKFIEGYCAEYPVIDDRYSVYQNLEACNEVYIRDSIIEVANKSSDFEDYLEKVANLFRSFGLNISK